jgi:hypothetical protein
MQTINKGLLIYGQGARCIVLRCLRHPLFTPRVFKGIRGRTSSMLETTFPFLDINVGFSLLLAIEPSLIDPYPLLLPPDFG